MSGPRPVTHTDMRKSWVYWRREKWKVILDLRNSAAQLAHNAPIHEFNHEVARQAMLDAADALEAAPR